VNLMWTIERVWGRNSSISHGIRVKASAGVTLHCDTACTSRHGHW